MFVEILLVIFVFVVISIVFNRFQFFKCDSNICLNGKTALVTGGSKGLGYEIVLQLASRGCRVIIASRTVSENLRNRIIEETHNPNIVVECVDFASFNSVRNLAEKLKKNESKLDILINNAGVGKSSNRLSEDGINRTMQVNHYSSFLITHLLLDLLKKSENGKILFTSSYLAHFHVISRNSVTQSGIMDSPLSSFDYMNSKFCAIITAVMFAEKLRKWNITSNCYHPGLAKTEIFQETRKNLANVLDIIMYYCTIHVLEIILGVSPKIPSESAVQIVIGKEFDNVTGDYIGKYLKKLRPRGAHDRKLCEAIWNASEIAVKLNPEEILK